MIALAKKELVKLFSTGKVFRPGNLEDLFAGRWSLDLGYWRATPHFPALAQLVNEGIVDFGIMPDGDVVYAKTGKLPKKAKK